MSKSKVTISGIAASGRDGQFWPLVTGPQAPEVPFTVHQSLSEKLAVLGNPVNLAIKGVHQVGLDEKRTDITIDGLYLLRKESGLLRGHRYTWVITDIRYAMQNLWVFSSFGERRMLNEFIGFGVGGQEDFNRTSPLAYIPSTQRDLTAPGGSPRFASGSTGVEDHARWTAKQGVLWMLDGFFATELGKRFKAFNGADKPEVLDLSQDNKRPLVDFRTNRPWWAVMTKLLRLAHIGMYVDTQGRIVLYDLTPVSLEGLGGYRGGGEPSRQDLSRQRPKSLRVYFHKEVELRFNYAERDIDASETATTQERADAGKRDINLWLENVMVLPQDITDARDGKVWRRGTIISIAQALDLFNNDRDNPPPALMNSEGKVSGSIAFNFAFLRRHITSPALATKMTLMPRFSNATDVVWASRAAAFYQHYRQTFRIAPVWLDMLNSMRLERVAIQDPISGKRAPSPVFMDHFIEYSARYFLYKNSGTEESHPAGQNVLAWEHPYANITDFSVLPLTLAKASPAMLSWVNARQGVFRVGFLPDLYGNTIRRIPATFANIPVVAQGGLRTYLLSEMEYASNWRFSTIISGTLRTPNDHRRMFWIDYDKNTQPGTDADAQGPHAELLFTGVNAGVAWLDDNQVDAEGEVIAKASRITDGERGRPAVEVQGGALVNPRTLNDAAEALLEDVKFRTRDRETGTYRTPGIDAALDVPRGHVTAVTLQHVDGRIEAVHGANAPTDPPTLWERLPEATRNVLFRLESEPPK